MEKSCRKCVTKLVPDSILILVSNPKQPLHAKNSFKKIKYFERRLSKSLTTVNLTFFLNPVPFSGKSYQKQKRLGTSDQLLFRLQ